MAVLKKEHGKIINLLVNRLKHFDDNEEKWCHSCVKDCLLVNSACLPNHTIVSDVKGRAALVFA